MNYGIETEKKLNLPENNNISKISRGALQVIGAPFLLLEVFSLQFQALSLNKKKQIVSLNIG